MVLPLIREDLFSLKRTLKNVNKWAPVGCLGNSKINKHFFWPLLLTMFIKMILYYKINTIWKN